MNEELRDRLNRIKFCMKRSVPVKYCEVEYIVNSLNLKYYDDFYYTVTLTDPRRLNSTLIVSIELVEFPTEGGRYYLNE